VSTVFEKLQEFNKDFPAKRVDRKFKLLSYDPFSFFRGTNQLFYEDLSKVILPSSPISWICGDLHIENFGSYKGDNRLVYFDLNDFDESILAPVAWELARVLTSIMVAFDSLKITDREAKKACDIFLKKYSSILAQGSPRYIETRTAKGIVKRFLNTVEDRPDKKLLGKHTVKKKGNLHLSKCERKQLTIDDKLKRKLIKTCQRWMKSNNEPPNDYKVLDVRFRFAGTGSIGIHRYLFLIQKINDPNKYMLIDMKQATASSLSAYVKIDQPKWKSEAERMVYIQKMMQNIPPAQLSALDFKGESYLMQEMQPAKDRINFKVIEDDFKVVCRVIEDMAMITASAHLRGIGRKGSCSSDDLIAFGDEKSWHTELLKYALNYKNKVMSDYLAFKNEWKLKSSSNP
jgi:uncharacterized protein (DUF2252 family)